MNLKKPEIDGRLPEGGRVALIRAAETGAPGSLDRRIAIDRAIREARLHHPAYFREEAHCEVRGCE